MQLKVARSAFQGSLSALFFFSSTKISAQTVSTWRLTDKILGIGQQRWIITEQKPSNLLHRRTQLRWNLGSASASDLARYIFLAFFFVSLSFISTLNYTMKSVICQTSYGKCPHLITRLWPTHILHPDWRIDRAYVGSNCIDTMWTEPFTMSSSNVCI